MKIKCGEEQGIVGRRYLNDALSVDTAGTWNARLDHQYLFSRAWSCRFFRLGEMANFTEISIR
jgi:hypothetical protein